MSKAVTLTDILKSAPTATSLSGLSIMLLSSAGDLQKLNSQIIPFLIKQKLNLYEIKRNGIFILAFGSTGMPTGVGSTDNILICLGNGIYWFQIFLRIGDGGQIWARIYDSDHWDSWKQILT